MAEQRVAMISGASRGIGAAIARKLLAEGWFLSLGNRDGLYPEWAPDNSHVQVRPYEATAGVENDWTTAALDRFGQIDAVIANAGLMISRSVIEADDAELEEMLAVNVMAPRRLVKSAWEALKGSGQGRVIIMASLSGKRVASVRSSLYSMTKFAAVALAHGLRHEGWPHGIRATAICPGLVDTDMARSFVSDPTIEMTTPGDIAQTVNLALNLSNSASIAEIAVNCKDGEIF